MKKICIILVVLFGVFIIARSFELVRPFKNSGLGMVPSLNADDLIVMEGVSYHLKKPRRGDIIVFKTEGIPSCSPGQHWVKRVIGEPGEKIRIQNGKVIINGEEILIENKAGIIKYMPLSEKNESENIEIPRQCYYVLGDNSSHSFDSRMIGVVPEKNIIGKVSLRYSPLNQAGFIK